jgi:hypothetical protein
MTNYRTGDFEFEFDIGDLFEYENPGTGGFGMSTTPKASYVMIENFGAGSFSLPADFEKSYGKILLRVAHLLAAAQLLNMPSEVALMGYPDAPGSDLATTNLAFKRADAVRTKLRELVGVAKGSADKVTFSIYTNTAPGASLKQCVDVRLPMTCQTFFADYDQQSFSHPVIGFEANPTVTNKLDRYTQLIYVKQELDIRLADRAKLILADTIKQAKRETREHVLKAARLFSTIQIELFRKYHPGAQAGFDVSKLMSCFMKFANGELRSPHPDFDKGTNKGRQIFGVGEPDSSDFFIFAEFAFLCIESGIDVDAWTLALPALVAPQEVFMHVYRRDPKPPPPPVGEELPKTPIKGSPPHPLARFGAKNFQAIDSSNQTKGKGQSDAARIATLSTKYSGLGVSALREAAALNLLRAQMLR